MSQARSIEGRRRDRAALLATLTILIFGLMLTPLAGAADVTVAVVRDGPGPDDRLTGLIEAELPNHTARGTTVRFKSDRAFDAGWRYDAASGALQAAFDDPDVDYVLALGSLVTYAAARSGAPLAKPVVSTFVQRSDVFKLPYSDDGQSLRDNLSFIVIPRRADADVAAFRDLVGFDALHVAVTAADLISAEELQESLERYERELGLRIVVVSVEEDIAPALEQLSRAEAVYVTRLQRLAGVERQRMIDALNEAGVPTFSELGHPDVEKGLLAGTAPDFESQVVRRVAINLGRLIDGRAATELPVLLSVESKLLINARTAKAIGFSPPRETRIAAEFLHPEELEPDSRAIELAELFELAQSGSRSLQLVDADLEGVRIDESRARSSLLPQLSANISYERADTDLTTSEDGAFASVLLRQSLYDDQLWSALKSSKRFTESVEFEREAKRLDVLASAGQAFYGLALAQAQYRIAAGDLRLTESNLEMARLRRDIGYSGREEVLRWESVLAQRRTSLFRAAQTAETARIALNQVLGRDQSTRWTPVPPRIDPEVFPFLGGALAELFADFATMREARLEVAAVAVEAAPELQALDRAIAAQEIQVAQLKRRYVLPRFFLEGAYLEQITPPEGVIYPEDDSFSISVNAAYQLFEGGRRKADLARSRQDQESLSRQRALVAELVEQRARTAMQRCENSFPRIKFSIQAAEAASESLELIQDQYAQGLVNVTDLLDAQNQKLTADQFASLAIYEFMGDLIEFQRSIAWFELDKTPEERDAFVRRALSSTSEE